jgi:hypothetical protein
MKKNNLISTNIYCDVCGKEILIDLKDWKKWKKFEKKHPDTSLDMYVSTCSKYQDKTLKCFRKKWMEWKNGISPQFLAKKLNKDLIEILDMIETGQIPIIRRPDYSPDMRIPYKEAKKILVKNKIGKVIDLLDYERKY